MSIDIMYRCEKCSNTSYSISCNDAGEISFFCNECNHEERLVY